MGVENIGVEGGGRITMEVEDERVGLGLVHEHVNLLVGRFTERLECNVGGGSGSMVGEVTVGDKGGTDDSEGNSK